MRIFIVTLLLLACVACTHAQREPSDADDARTRYFVEPRAFPFATIPAGARREALETMRRTRRVESASIGSWRPVGTPTLGVAFPYGSANGRVTAIAISPADPHVMLIGASGGGILRSTDGGTTFVPVTDDQTDISVGDIAFANANVVYAGMGDSIIGLTLGSGVLRSDDAGATWRHVSTGNFLERGAIRRVVTDPDNPEKLWVAQSVQLASNGAIVDGGIFESSDGGHLWTPRLFGNANSVARVNATTLVGSMFGQIVQSTDGGAHWSTVLRTSFAGEIALATTPLDPSLVYAAASGGTTVQILVSHDAGATWQVIVPSGLADDSPRFGYLAVSPSDTRTLYRGILDVWRSTDGGGHWTNLSNAYDSGGNFTPSRASMHADQHAIAFGSDGKTWLSNDGGLYVSADGAQHVSFAGPPATSLVELYGVSAHPLDASRLYGATQDNGLETSRNGLWSEARTGDYGTVLFDPNNPQRFMSNYVYGNIDLYDVEGSVIRSLTTNTTFSEPEEHPARIDFIAPLVMNRTAYAVYFATWRMFVSHDFGTTWHPTAGTTDLTRDAADYVSAIGVTEENPNAIYTGSGHGHVMRSVDAGVTWSNVTGNLPLRAVSSIAVTGDGTNAWVAFSGFHSGHIYRTIDGGATWSRADAGLPDIPVDTLFVDGTTLWAGTDAGAFRLSDSGLWEQLGSGMPPVIVTAFAHTADGRLVAATHGRGVFEFVPAAPPSPRRRSAPH